MKSIIILLALLSTSAFIAPLAQASDNSNYVCGRTDLVSGGYWTSTHFRVETNSTNASVYAMEDASSLDEHPAWERLTYTLASIQPFNPAADLHYSYETPLKKDISNFKETFTIPKANSKHGVLIISHDDTERSDRPRITNAFNCELARHKN